MFKVFQFLEEIEMATVCRQCLFLLILSSELKNCYMSYNIDLSVVMRGRNAYDVLNLFRY